MPTLTPDKWVMVEGQFLATETTEFQLRSLECAYLGGDRFTEVYFETNSGNTYCIRNRAYHGFYDGGEWELLNLGIHARKGRHVRGYAFSKEEIEEETLVVGQPFIFGRSGTTTRVLRITCVNYDRIYDAQALQEMTGGATTDIREHFWQAIATR